MQQQTKSGNGVSFKFRIILTFSAITILLVGIISWASYRIVRNIYLDQLSDQVKLLSQIIASQLDTKYLSLLNPTDQKSLAKTYYRQTLAGQIRSMELESAFIFNRNLQTLIHTNPGKATSSMDAKLLLNRKEIKSLASGQSISSFPFKGDDGRWYMWGFYRLGKQHWLGIRENANRLAQVESLARTFWIAGFCGVLLSIAAGWFLARTIARPVDELVKFSRVLGKGTFKEKAPENIRGELAVLANAMDQMRSDLAQSQKEREEMLAQIAHEIRNPLGGMELLAGLVKEDLAGEGKGLEYIQKILDEINNLKGLITAYLNYSRPLQAKPQWVHIKPLMEEIENLFRKRLQGKQIKISCNGGDEPVYFDPNHLKQILINLLNNSVEATNSNGHIRVRTINNNREFKILVSDDGPGITEEDLQAVFKPFYTTREEGTGLGLAICKKLCLQNGADITVENNESRGCTFTIVKKDM